MSHISALWGRPGEAGTGLRRVWAGSGLVLTFESHSLCCILPLPSPDLYVSHTRDTVDSDGLVSACGEKQSNVLRWKPKCGVAVIVAGKRCLAWRALPRPPFGDLKSLSQINKRQGEGGAYSWACMRQKQTMIYSFNPHWNPTRQIFPWFYRGGN